MSGLKKTDLEPDGTGVTYLEDAMRVVGVKTGGGYPWGLLFGEIGNKEGFEVSPEGLALGISRLVDRWLVSGSVTTLMGEGSLIAPEVRSVMNHRLSPDLLSVSEGDVKLRRRMDENGGTEHFSWLDWHRLGMVDVDRLSEEQYLRLQVLTKMSGPNVDLIGTADEPKRAMEDLVALMRVTGRYLVDGGVRWLSLRNYNDRVLSLHAHDSGGGVSGGMNVMVMTEGGVERDRWLGMTNLREIMQTHEMRVEDGEWVFDHVEMDDGHKIEMIGDPDRQGEWAHHSARVIRTVVMHGWGADKLDLSTFEVREQNLEGGIDGWNLEDIVGLVSNLSVSYRRNPELTMEMMTKLGLDKLIEGGGEWGGQEMGELFVVGEYDDKEALGEVQKTMEMFWPRSIGVGWRKLIPEVGMRSDKIEHFLTGYMGMTLEGEKILDDAIGVLERLMVSGGDEDGKMRGTIESLGKKVKEYRG